MLELDLGFFLYHLFRLLLVPTNEGSLDFAHMGFQIPEFLECFFSRYEVNILQVVVGQTCLRKLFWWLSRVYPFQYAQSSEIA